MGRKDAEMKKPKNKKRPKALHFVPGSEVDWAKTAKLPRRKDGRFPGVVERGRRTRNDFFVGANATFVSPSPMGTDWADPNFVMNIDTDSGDTTSISTPRHMAARSLPNSPDESER